MKYTIQIKSWLEPVEMESGEIALRAVKHFLDNPDAWGQAERAAGVWEHTSTLEVWREILPPLALRGLKELESDTSCPAISVNIYRGSCETVYAVWICGAEEKKFPDTWTFVVLDHNHPVLTEGAQLMKLAEGVSLTGEDNGNICVQPGPDHYIFTPNDPAWPWPAFYPIRFTGLIRLGKLLKPGDTNPLTGLCGARDSSCRTLAKQVAEELRAIYAQVAADIIAAI